MPYTTNVAGTTITAAWGNANVRDQVVTPFASSAARTSAITSPVAGMLSYLTGTKQLEPYDGSAWVPVNGTMVAYGLRTTAQTFSGTEIGVLRLDGVSMRLGYRYTVVAPSLRFAVTSGETAKSSLRYSTSGAAATSDTVLQSVEANANSGFTPAQSQTLMATFTPGSNLTFSVLLTLYRAGGSNNVTMSSSSVQPIELFILAAGPDPTNTGVVI